MAIACPISRLPHESRSGRDDLALAAFDPTHGKHAQPSNGASDCQRKEEPEDYVHHHQQTVNGSDTETEYNLIAPPARRRSRVSHHVERVEDESDTCHRH